MSGAQEGKMVTVVEGARGHLHKTCGQYTSAVKFKVT
jgi:hypothetical protein